MLSNFSMGVTILFSCKAVINNKDWKLYRFVGIKWKKLQWVSLEAPEELEKGVK